MNKKSFLYTSVMLALASSAFSALAQDENSGDKTIKANQLEAISVIGNEVNSIDSTLPNVKRIGQNQLNSPSVVDIPSALENQTSIDFSTNGYGIVKYLNIRGLGEDYTDVTVDGSKLPSYFTYAHGFYNTGEMEGIDISTIKQIDIIEGRYSPKQSGGALAGTINLRTYRPTDFVNNEKPYYVALRSGYTSKNTGWSNSLTGAFNSSNFSSLLMYTNRNYHEMKNKGTSRDKTLLDNIAYKQNNILAKGEFTFRENDKLIFTGEYYDLKRNISERYSKKPTIKEPSKRIRFGVEGEFYNLYTFDQVKIYSNYSKSKNTNGFYSGTKGGQFKLGKFKHTYFNLGIDLIKNIDTHLVKQSILSGIGFSSNKFDFFIQPEKSPAYRNNPITKHNTLYAYIKDDINFDDKFIVSPGIRIEHKKQSSKVDSLYEKNIAVKTQGFIPGGSESKVLPSLNLTWFITPDIKVYSSYSEGSKSANDVNFASTNHYGMFYIVPNPDLKDEKSQNIELGISSALFSHKLNIKASTFYSKYKDFITNKSVKNYKNTGVPGIIPINLDESKVYGAELKINWDINELLTTNFAITAMRGHSVKPNGKKIVMNNITPFKAILGVNYHKVDWGTEIKWKLVSKGKKSLDENGKEIPNTFRTPGYGLVDLTAWWKPMNNITLSGGVYNVFNKKYWLMDQNGSYTTDYYKHPINMDKDTQPGRNFALNLKVEF